MLAIALAGASACATDSAALEDSQKLASLELEAVRALCREHAAAFPERMITCSADEVIVVGNDAGVCEKLTKNEVPATCTATVGEARKCTAVLATQSDQAFCTQMEFPPECAYLTAADCGGQ